MNSQLDTIQKISSVIFAIKSGKLKLRPEDQEWASKLLALPSNIVGVVDISSLDEEAMQIAKATALSLEFFEQENENKLKKNEINYHTMQCDLFEHYESVFISLTDIPSKKISDVEEIRLRVIEHLNEKTVEYFNEKRELIFNFYKNNSVHMYDQAVAFGGVKTVTGGQRAYTRSALEATRIAGLYCDTQLIPDPIYPFICGDLNLNAKPLQLAIALFYILQVRPLIDAQLPVPPIFIFPSFEQELNSNDVITKIGISNMMLQVVAPSCDATITSIEELQEFASSYETLFLNAIERERLFVPPGGDPEKLGPINESIKAYLNSLRGIRKNSEVVQLEQLPSGLIVFNAVFERLVPIYHLIENSTEMSAQPLLNQSVHWHYFERCSRATAQEMVNKRVLTSKSLTVLRALQDDSLSWLSKIPIEGLVEMRRNLEHAEFREKLQKCTEQLALAGAEEDIESVLKEVRHSLNVMIQSQQKALKNIEEKYAQTNWGIYAGAITGIGVSALSYLPAFSAFSGIAAPVSAIVVGVGARTVEYANSFARKKMETKATKKTMIGMLAVARSKS